MKTTDIINKSILELETICIAHPRRFSKEDSVKTYLSHLILNNSGGKLLVGTEIKTKEDFVQRNGKLRLAKKNEKGHKAKYDIIVVKREGNNWDFKSYLYKSKKMYAIEIKFYSTNLKLIKNDIRKMKITKNRIYRGFSVILLDEKFDNKTEEEIEKNFD